MTLRLFLRSTVIGYNKKYSTPVPNLHIKIKIRLFTNQLKYY
ncbi:hypothetical protein CRENPOLYSF1_770025 [Crenothrix polyspora]|uniref:Uncharacterized protein n=1 Tax=Crenothrix polyspora TaxID=360316 RepID=A0A1R4HHH0_9GAMM|nr:hypothetical protein CRENPOLYSF1_770025 [Crenothrix polyspora]